MSDLQSRIIAALRILAEESAAAAIEARPQLFPAHSNFVADPALGTYFFDAAIHKATGAIFKAILEDERGPAPPL